MPFALVGFRFSYGTNFRGKLANFLLIDTFDHHMGLIRTGDIQTRRNLLLNFIGEADSQLQHAILNRSQVADTMNF